MKIVKIAFDTAKRVIAKKLRRRKRTKGKQFNAFRGETLAMRLMSQFYHMGQPTVSAKSGQFRAANREGLQRVRTIRADKARAANGHVPKVSRQVLRRIEMGRAH